MKLMLVSILFLFLFIAAVMQIYFCKRKTKSSLNIKYGIMVEYFAFQANFQIFSIEMRTNTIIGGI